MDSLTGEEPLPGLPQSERAELALTDFEQFKRTLAELEANGADLLVHLGPLFRSPDIWVRLNAIDAVAELRLREVCGLLASVVQDPDELVRNAAVETMGILGCSGEILVSRTGDERSPLVLASLAEAIGNLRYELGRSRLRGLTHHEDEAVRGYAVSSLGILRAEDDLEFLNSLARTERSPRVLPALHVALYSFDSAFADAVLADLRSEDCDLVGLTLRELTYVAEERPPQRLQHDGARFMAAVEGSGSCSRSVGSELAKFESAVASP